MDEEAKPLTKQCPHCAEDIKFEAKVCKHCRLEVKSKRALNANESARLQSEIEQSAKSVGVAYLLWFVLGGVGAHQFYAGSVLGGMLYVFILIAGFFTGGVTVVAFLVAWVIDAFVLGGQVKRYNARAAEKIRARYERLAEQ